MKKTKICLLLTVICILITSLSMYVYATDETELVPGVDYVENELLVYTRSAEDYELYKDGSDNFYGVPIVALTKLVWHRYDTPEEIAIYLERTGGYYTYVATIDTESISALEAKEILNNVEGVQAYLNGIYELDGYTVGDIDCNGKIEARDYLLLKRAYFGTYNLEGNAVWAADVNGNGKFDSRDYLLLKRVYFGTYNIV